MSKALVITYKEKHPKTGREEVFISHGVDMETGRNIVMEPVMLREAPYVKLDPDLGYIYDDGKH